MTLGLRECSHCVTQTACVRVRHVATEPELSLRPMTDSDVSTVLALNAADVTALSPLDDERLTLLRKQSAHALIAEAGAEVVGFVLTFAPGSGYDSDNFAWFGQRYGSGFLYLDRIVIGSGHRRLGFAGRVYDALENEARAYGRLVCEVNSRPPNAASLAFHAVRGYAEVGHLAHGDDKVTVMLCKELPS
jgi:predicted GNAT superfamily acetyltransferase